MRIKRTRKLFIVTVLAIVMTMSSVQVSADVESSSEADKYSSTAETAARELNECQALSSGPFYEESDEALSENICEDPFNSIEDDKKQSGFTDTDASADPSFSEQDIREEAEPSEPSDDSSERNNTDDGHENNYPGEAADNMEDPGKTEEDPATSDAQDSDEKDVSGDADSQITDKTDPTGEETDIESDAYEDSDEQGDPEEQKQDDGSVSEKKEDSGTDSDVEKKKENNESEEAEQNEIPASKEDKKKITEEEASNDVSASASDLSLSSMTRYGAFYFKVGKMTAPGGIKKARIAVWCSADKSDKKWYDVDLNTNKAACSVSNHKYHFGLYTAKLFITDAAGNVYYAGYCKKEYKYTVPACDYVTMTMNSRSSMEFTVTVKGLVSYRGIGGLQAAVWSADDQSDLFWYTSYKNLGKGTFTFTGSLEKHKYRQSIYTAHIYLTDKTGEIFCVGGGTKKIKIIPGDVSAVYNKDTFKTDLSLPSIKYYGLLDHVEYSIWRDGGDKSDLKTYSVDPGDGYFEKTVSMTKFSGNGTYKVSCYGVSITGKKTYYGETSFKATNIPLKVTYEFNRISRAKVSITVYNANVNGVLADHVEMATWSDAVSVVSGSNQDDLVWYEGVKNADGSFTCTINRSNHISSGMFHTHIYAYTGTKSAFCLGLNYKLYKTKSFAGKYLEFARKSILAVESGGQVYGNARYDAFAPAYNISSAETGITIGAGQWMGTRAVKLLIQIRNTDPVLFAATAPIINADLTKLEALPESKWAYYGSTVVAKDMTATSKRGKQIKAVISTETGIAVQNSLINADLSASAEQIKNAGVTDTDAIVFMVNVAHLGGVSAAYRIIKAAKAGGLDLIVEDLWTTMQKDVDDTTSSVQVGDSIFHSRHLKIIGWIYDYLN